MELDLEEADGLLIIGASESNADLFHATRFRAPDPYTFLWTAGEKLLMVSDLEVDRARGQAAVDSVLASSEYEQRLRDRGVEQPGADAVLLELLRERGVGHVLVPADFPLGKGDALRSAGLQVTVAPGPLFPARQIKTEEEVGAIRAAMRAAELAMQAAIEAIRASAARGGVLELGGETLTSERVRALIHRTLIDQACTARHTIVAGGDQGCDPHQEGTGPLRPGESIIIDIFPQADASGYFGDITRTVVKGDAPDPLRQLYAAVRRGQLLALERIRHGADGRALHQEVLQLFGDAGYETGERNGHRQGFFHGTGHGVGLEIHEAPRIGLRGDILQAGQVVTVEPGLYYPGVGGVRIEDTVVVRADGCENLATYPKSLEV